MFRLIFSRFNQMALGGRVKGMLSGGAALAEDTQRFVQTVLCVKLFQGYGLTETCAAGTIADRNYLFNQKRISLFYVFFRI
jgi:long-chain acyl-CoA synthetase